jgi:protein-S-isoprenylcysteine O-methyltransferase Ste14
MGLRVVSIVGLVLMIVAIAMLFLHEALLGETAIPIAIQILSLLLMIWARIVFGRRSFHAAANPTAGGVVSSGPYALIRHPIYAAALYIAWAGILSHISLVSVAWGLVVAAGAALRIAAEEKLVTERYPEYASYALRTKRIIPYLL